VRLTCIDHYSISDQFVLYEQSRNRLIDSYASEHDVLRKSQREVREMNTIANNVVQAMREQREKFKVRAACKLASLHSTCPLTA